MLIQPTSSYSLNNQSFTHLSKHNEPASKADLASSACAALGVAASVAMIAKRQGFSLKPSKIMKTPVKDWAIFKITDKTKPGRKILQIKAPQILTMGIGSVLGGLAGGAVFDKKENFGAKCSEAVNQILGDITVPLAFVALPTMLYKKFEGLAQKETEHITLQSASKVVAGNKVLRILCPVIVSGTSLAAGIIAGNRVSNKFNEKVHGEKPDRGIRLTDFAPHLDDVCLAITLMAEKSPVGDIISKLVPVALTIAGIETGRAKHPHHTNGKDCVNPRHNNKNPNEACISAFPPSKE